MVKKEKLCRSDWDIKLLSRVEALLNKFNEGEFIDRAIRVDNYETYMIVDDTGVYLYLRDFIEDKQIYNLELKCVIRAWIVSSTTFNKEGRKKVKESSAADVWLGKAVLDAIGKIKRVEQVEAIYRCLGFVVRTLD